MQKEEKVDNVKSKFILFSAILAVTTTCAQYRVIGQGDTPDKKVKSVQQHFEQKHGVDLHFVSVVPERIGQAANKNCENMFGHLVMPLGMLSELNVLHSNGTSVSYSVPIATTEGALVASLNRGAKALNQSQVSCTSHYVGVTRAPVFTTEDPANLAAWLESHRIELCAVAAATSNHLQLLHWTTYIHDNLVYVRFVFDTDAAMGMNMATIASRALANFIEREYEQGATCLSLSSNMCCDKKPAQINKDLGRGYTVKVEVLLTHETLATVLKTTADAMYQTWYAKNKVGSQLAGLLGNNCHVANVVAGMFIALGQDSAHVVEASLADLACEKVEHGVLMRLIMPALMVGAVGGGTALPAQRSLHNLLNLSRSGLHECAALAQVIATTCLAGEISLLAALSARQLTKAHVQLAR